MSRESRIKSQLDSGDSILVYLKNIRLGSRER